MLALKGNEKLAVAAVAAHFKRLDEAPCLPAEHRFEATIELSHGRFEKREIIVTQNLAWWPKSWTWPGLKSVVRVRRATHRGGKQAGELVLETHYYLSSQPAEAQRLAKVIREHWAVENHCHWVLDLVRWRGSLPSQRCQRRTQPEHHAGNHAQSPQELPGQTSPCEPSASALR